jgi:hypothetical protein
MVFLIYRLVSINHLYFVILRYVRNLRGYMITYELFKVGVLFMMLLKLREYATYYMYL